MFNKLSLFVSLTTLLLVFCMMCPLLSFSVSSELYTGSEELWKYPYTSSYRWIDGSSVYMNQISYFEPAADYRVFYVDSDFYTPPTQYTSSAGVIQTLNGAYNVDVVYAFEFLDHDFSFEVMLSDLASTDRWLQARRLVLNFDYSSYTFTTQYLDYNGSVLDSTSFTFISHLDSALFAGLLFRTSSDGSTLRVSPFFFHDGFITNNPFMSASSSISNVPPSDIVLNLPISSYFPSSFSSVSYNSYVLGFSNKGSSFVADGQSEVLRQISYQYTALLQIALSSPNFRSHVSSSSSDSDEHYNTLLSILSSISSDVESIKSALDEIYKDAVGVEGDSVPVPELPQPDYSAGEALDQTFNNYADYDSISNLISSWTSANYLNGLLVFGNILTVFVDSLDFLKMLFSLVVLFIICGIVRGLPYNTLSKKFHSRNEKPSKGSTG